MKVCIYTHFFYPSTGGVEAATLALADYLMRRGMEVTVITRTSEGPSKRDFSFKVIGNSDILQLNRIVSDSDAIYTMGFNLPITLLSILHRKPLIWDHPGHDLICPKDTAWDGQDCNFSLFKCFKCLSRDWPIIYAVWLPISLVLRRIFSRLIRWHILHSRYMADEVKDWLPHPLVFPPTVDVKVNDRSSRKVTDRRILFVGRLIPEKGAQVLVKALAILKSCNIKLDIVGNGWFKPQLKVLVKKLGLSDMVTFHGRVSELSLEEIYNTCDIVVIPSVWHEPFGLVALEAMSHGKPVIVSRSGGLPEVVKDGALAFRRGDYKDLASKVRTLIMDRELAEKLSNRGHGIASKYALDKIGEGYFRLLNQLAERG